MVRYFFVLLVLVTNLSHATVMSSAAVNSQVQESITFTSKRLFSDLSVQIPLPSGSWTVRYVSVVKSTHKTPPSGLLVYLEQLSGKELRSSLVMEIYPQKNLNWSSNGCVDGLFNRERGSSINGYCHALKASDFMTNSKSDWQGSVRKLWRDDSTVWSKKALIFGGTYEKRGDFIVYSWLSVPANAIGLSEQLTQRASPGDVESWWKQNAESSQLIEVIRWYENYSATLAAAVVGESYDVSPSLFAEPIHPRLLKLSNDLHLANFLGRTVYKGVPPPTEDGQAKKTEPSSAEAMSALSALKKIRMEEQALSYQQAEVRTQELSAQPKKDTPSFLYKCIGSPMVFSDSKTVCMSNYSTIVKGLEARYPSFRMRDKSKFFAAAVYGSPNSGYLGWGHSELTMPAAMSRATHECNKRLRRDGYPPTVVCSLLMRAERGRALQLSVPEEEFHKTWPSDQLIYERNVEMYGEEYAKSQLSEPPPQVQAEAKAELSALEKALAEAEEAKSEKAELEAQLAAAQQQAQLKPTAPVGPRLSVHAIVIGNGAYQGSGRLDNPINDARAISAKLTGMGFKVTTVENADRTKLVSSLVKFSASAAESDLTLFFYAGHGVQISGTNYMLPTDTNLNQIGGVALHGISLNSVVEQFLPGKTKLVFLDACRDNPLLQLASRSVSRGLAPISVSQGTLISYATKDGSVAADGDGKNSPFTKALLQHIDTPEDIAVVLRKIRDQVMRDTGGQQQPWEYGSLSGGSLILSAIRAK